MLSRLALVGLSVLISVMMIVPGIALYGGTSFKGNANGPSALPGVGLSESNSSYRYYYPMSTLSLYNNSIFPGNSISRPHGYFNAPLEKPEMAAYDTMNHNLYISSSEFVGGSAYIYVVNTSTNSLVDKISITSFQGGDVVYNPADNELYAAVKTDSGKSGNVLVINPVSNTVSKEINIGTTVFGEVLVPDKNQVFVAGEDNHVTVINCSTDTIFRNITMSSSYVSGDYNPPSPFLLAYSAATGVVYATMYGRGTVSLISPVNYSVFGNISVGSTPRGIVYDPVNYDLYVSNSDTISVINTTSNTLVATIGNLGKYGEPAYFSFDPDTNQIYVDGQGYGNVWAINGSDNKIVADLSVGLIPMGVTYIPSNKEVMLVNEEPGTVSIIKPTLSVMPVYPVPITEDGLPTGSVWYINGSATGDSGPIVRGTYIAYLSNGTYTLTIKGPAGFVYSETDKMAVNGIDSSFQIVFTPIAEIYNIAIATSGIIAFILTVYYLTKRKQREGGK